jgi:hypothetical protein
MKIVENENYPKYLNKKGKLILSQTKKLIGIGIILIGFGIYGFEEGFYNMNKLFFFLSTMISIAFLFSKVCSIIFTRVIYKNDLISLLFLTTLTSIINLYWFGLNALHSSFIGGLVLSIIITSIVAWGKFTSEFQD